MISAFEYVFPLTGGKSIEGGEGVLVEQVYGTSFFVENSNFVVAGHSLRSALQHERVGLSRVQNGFWHHVDIRDHEIIGDYDIGFVKAEIAEAKALNWELNELAMLVEIQTVGFPFALDLKRVRIRLRAFKGHIVSATTWYELPGNPRSYELSFACPRGLSGAPLFTDQPAKVVGMIIGNQSTEMRVYTDKEMQKEDGTPVRETVRYEATQFGVAIQTRSLQAIESHILGGSVIEYLRSVGLA